MPRSLVLLALGGTLAASAAAAAPSAATPPLPACNGPHASVLQAAPALPTTWAPARAAWLDGSRFRWSGSPTEGRYRLGPGTLYDNLQRLLEQGMVQELGRRPGDSDPRRRYYRLSSLGRGVLAAEISRLEGVVRHARLQLRRA